MKKKLKIFSISGLTGLCTLVLLILNITEKASSMISDASDSPGEKRKRYTVTRIEIKDSSENIIQKANN